MLGGRLEKERGLGSPEGRLEKVGFEQNFFLKKSSFWRKEGSGYIDHALYFLFKML